MTSLSVTTSKPPVPHHPQTPWPCLWCGPTLVSGWASHAWHDYSTLFCFRSVTSPEDSLAKARTPAHAHALRGVTARERQVDTWEAGVWPLCGAGILRLGVAAAWLGGTLMRGWSQSSARCAREGPGCDADLPGPTCAVLRVPAGSQSPRARGCDPGAGDVLTEEHPPHPVAGHSGLPGDLQGEGTQGPPGGRVCAGGLSRGITRPVL